METLSREFKTNTLTLRLRDDSVLEVDFLPNQTIEAYDINQMLRAVCKISNGKKFKNLVAVGASTRVDMEAMKLCCGIEGSRHKIATAFVIKKTTQRVMGQILTSLFRPKNPTRFFASRLQAENWLESLHEN
jgi:hypothetical protein